MMKKHSKPYLITRKYVLQSEYWTIPHGEHNDSRILDSSQLNIRQFPMGTTMIL